MMWHSGIAVPLLLLLLGSAGPRQAGGQILNSYSTSPNNILLWAGYFSDAISSDPNLTDQLKSDIANLVTRSVSRFARMVNYGKENSKDTRTAMEDFLESLAEILVVEGGENLGAIRDSVSSCFQIATWQLIDGYYYALQKTLADSFNVFIAESKSGTGVGAGSDTVAVHGVDPGVRDYSIYRASSGFGPENGVAGPAFGSGGGSGAVAVAGAKSVLIDYSSSSVSSGFGRRNEQAGTRFGSEVGAESGAAAVAGARPAAGVGNGFRGYSIFSDLSGFGSAVGAVGSDAGVGHGLGSDSVFSASSGFGLENGQVSPGFGSGVLVGSGVGTGVMAISLLCIFLAKRLRATYCNRPEDSEKYLIVVQQPVQSVVNDTSSWNNPHEKIDSPDV